MSVTSTNRAYKVTSLLIKAAILILSTGYILHKLTSADPDSNFFIASQYITVNYSLLFLTCLLMFFNWGIEALKWKILIAPLEHISFKTAMQSVFAGVTVSIFMPNRVGEFAGRIFFLEKADKVEATLKNFLGSFMQLSMTLIVGILALVPMMREGSLQSPVISESRGMLLLVAFAAAFVLPVVLNRYREKFSAKVQSYFKVVFDTDRKTLLTVLFLSALRYAVFLLQYALVLCAFGVWLDPLLSVQLIAVTFLVTSLVPSFAFTEISTRGAAAMYLFSAYTTETAAVVTASLVIWIINLAAPAIIGSAFTWKLKFFRS
ncbi:MAG: hypothetical protein JWO44_2541 [Bacteroidetes bacterium]|nr:hypothetical protein [Bacteroidota bacterium]